jgi:hypothetical protein
MYWKDYLSDEARFQRAMGITKLIYPFWCPDKHCFAFDEDDMKNNTPHFVKEIIDHVVSEIYALNDKKVLSIDSIIEYSETADAYDTDGETCPYYAGIEPICLDYVFDGELYIVQYVRYPTVRNDLIFHSKYLVGKYFSDLDIIIQCDEPVY